MLSSVPDCVSVRKGRPADAKALCEIYRDSWKLAYTGIIPEPTLEAMLRRRPQTWWAGTLRSREQTLVLEVSEKVAGYATWGPSRSRSRYQGEIFEIYLDPVHQGLGFGEHLFEACRHALDMAKLDGLIVWALAENTGAVDFYWRRGGRPVARIVDRVGGKKLAKIAFAWD